jgi:pimeloyl-ACP methyl ester carboxylesterase
MGTDGDADRHGRIGRRALLGAVATSVAGSTVASATDGDRGAPSGGAPYVTTRGHFAVENRWFADDEVVLTDGHSRYDYDTVGAVPGPDGPSPDELVVFAHGWKTEAEEVPAAFRTVREGLAAAGYGGPVVGYTYDADQGYTDWWQSTEIAERNGRKLAAYLADLAPDTEVHLVGHSLGGRVLAATLSALAGADRSVASASLLGAAVDADAVARDGEYGPAIGAAADRVDNFYKTDDHVLGLAYEPAEVASAVGEAGADGTPPANYADHDVGYVDDHFSYYESRGGCLPAVVERF